MIPALIGAGVCVFFISSGVLSLFFLVPLGFLGFRYDYKVAWAGFLFAVIGYLLMSMGNMFQGSVLNLLFFAAMTGIFTWIIIPPHKNVNMPMSIRIIGGSCLGAILLTFTFFRMISSPVFIEYLDSMLHNFLQSNTGANVVQNALLQSITVDDVLEMIMVVLLRGGGLISCILLFTFCRQISLGLARLIPGKNKRNGMGAGNLAAFHVNPQLIWALSASLLLLVLTRMINLIVGEIILWNILILCVILYMAQGLGILQFFLSRPSTPPFMGLLFVVLFIFLLISPVFNLILLGGLTILGIIENWVPFRVPKINGPPTTPQA